MHDQRKWGMTALSKFLNVLKSALLHCAKLKTNNNNNNNNNKFSSFTKINKNKLMKNK